MKKWMWFVVVCCLGCSSACRTPFAPGLKLIKLTWTDGSKGQVTISSSASSLGNISYPLFLTVGPINADSGLPKQGDKDSITHTISDKMFEKPVAFARMKRESGIALRDQKGKLIDRVAFIDFPKDAILVRDEKREQLCQKSIWDQKQTCTEAKRTKESSSLRAIRSDKDFLMLAETSGQQGVQIQEVKVLVDLQRDALPHYLNSRQWDLHYTWVREHIEKKSPLNRCDSEENKIFNRGWTDFSDVNYFRTDSRRFYLATIILYAGAKEYSLEFSPGDRIKYHQLVEAFRVLKNSFHAPLKVRPVTIEQRKELFHTNAENIPLMPMDQPYRGQTTQLLSPGVAYGTLTALSKTEVASHPLGLRIIALLKDVPNSINFTGGIISTNFQSALSHINVLSRNRGTPHLVLKNALTDPKIKALFGKLVRLEVTSDGYTIKLTSQKEAEAFWKRRSGAHQPWSPTRDITRKEFIDLAQSSYKDSTLIGAKAANMAELMKININQSWHSQCKQFSSHGTVTTPLKPFGIPFYWYIDHVKRAGYFEKIEAWHKDKKFLEDAKYRQTMLAELQKAILETEVNPELMQKLKAELPKRFGDRKVRFRSSTNVEDLPNFNGAGLYTSKSGRLNDPKKKVEDALRKVWASLWAVRAWSERQFYKIDQTQSAMGILVHPSFPHESANGVAISTNIFNRSYTTDTYIAVQKGGVSIVNPEGNFTPDQYLIRWYGSPEMLYLSYSNINDGKPVLARQESLLLGCYMQAIHKHFSGIFAKKDKPFAMDVEFKIDGPDRKLYIKQARPYIFGEQQGTNPACKEKP